MTRQLALRRAGGERGSAGLEMVIVAPVFLLLVAVLVFAGRVALAQQAVTAAAADAARTASITRTGPAATSAAASAAEATLTVQGLACASTQVDVDAAAFATVVGTPATVSVSVVCALNLSDLAVPGIPGTTLVRATMTSPLDTHRER